jgi:hypothetical protein
VSILRHLHLYPFPLSLIFETDLHFIAMLEPTPRLAAEDGR